MDWLTALLFSLAALEAVVLRWRKPESVKMWGSAAAFFIYFAKPWFAAPIKILLQTHLLGALIFTKLLFVVWPHRFFTISDSAWWVTPILFFATDFLHYWEHRLKHTIRWFWANHAVHHSSQVLNLSEAYRLGWTGWLSTNVFFFVPLVLVGFRPRDVVMMLMWHQVYQLFTHITWIPKLGFVEYMMVTPSHHRVHHAVNDKYIDRNFGGVLIIFDRMFGTFVEEDETELCRYGLLKPVTSSNPFVILLCGWKDLYGECRDVYQRRGILSAVAYAFRPLHTKSRPAIVEGRKIFLEMQDVVEQKQVS